MPLTAEIDGTDVTEWCQTIRWSPKFNLIDSGMIRVPGGVTTYTEGVSRLALYLNGTLVFCGPVWYTEAEGGTDSIYEEITAYDDRIYLTKVVCKWDDGGSSYNLINPGQVILDNPTAPEALAAYMDNAFNDPDAALYQPFGHPSSGPSAPLPITPGTVDTGGADISGRPMPFPMSIDRMRHMLTGTGQLDQIIHPGLTASTLDLLNDYNNDLSGSISLDYGIGAFNSQIATFTIDMKDMINALWYLLGPRNDKQHWEGSITPTAAADPPTGPPVAWPLALVTKIGNSRILYGYMQEINIFDQEGDEQQIWREMYEELWANEAWVRALPRTFASIRPHRGYVPAFRVGDIIQVRAGASLNGGFTGDQMVWAFDLSQDADGILSMDEIITSSDAQGAP